ncbi:MAG: hypothetical protein HZB65_02175 [Candidatus Aenigmarchaeota archaeon]|nr:hypothetical protein [Candidatus Aenigmarchaeota archaeon]
MASYTKANNLYESGKEFVENALYGIKKWSHDIWHHESDHDTECRFFCNSTIPILPGIRAPYHICVGYPNLEIPFQREPECENCKHQGKEYLWE